MNSIIWKGDSTELHPQCMATIIFVQVLNVFVKLSKADYDDSSIDLTTFYPDEVNQSRITWYLSDDELEELIQHESNGFIYVKPAKHQLRKVAISDYLVPNVLCLDQAKIDFNAEENAGAKMSWNELRSSSFFRPFLEDMEDVRKTHSLKVHC